MSHTLTRFALLSHKWALPVCCFSSLLSLPLCPILRLFFYLRLSFRNCLLSPLLIGCDGPPDTHFSQGTTRLMSWPDEKRYSCPLQSLVWSLTFYLSYPHVFRTGEVLYYLNSLTHRFPRFRLKILCSLVTLAVPFLVFAVMDTAFC